MTELFHVPTYCRFRIGLVAVSTGTLRKLSREVIIKAVARHALGDWGDVCPKDRDANESALKEGLRLFSVYHDKNGVKFWIITEADRRYTTVLLPGDY